VVLGGPYRAMSSALEVVVRWGASGEFDVPQPETYIVGADLPDVQGIAGAWHRHYLPRTKSAGARILAGGGGGAFGRGRRPVREGAAGGAGGAVRASSKSCHKLAYLVESEECGGADEPLLLGGRGNK
jgi:hypothetical protein